MKKEKTVPTMTLFTDNGDSVDVKTTVDIICNGKEKERESVPTMYINMESPVKPIVMYDNETPLADFSQFLMDKTYGQLEHVSHIKKPDSERYSRLYRTVQATVSNTNIFRLTYNLRTLTSATLKAILHTIAQTIINIKPLNPESENEANHEKTECIEKFEDIFSDIMMTFSQYRHPYSVTIRKDSPYEDAYVMARAVKEADRIIIEISNRIFDTLYGVLFARLSAPTIACIAEQLTPILALYRLNVITIILNGTIEQDTMNHHNGISYVDDPYNDDYDF